MKQELNNHWALSISIPAETEMLAFGGKLALEACRNNKLVIYLSGELGAGKTTLTRGFLRALGYNKPVKSPTYSIVEPYEIDDLKVYHFDLYRLTNAIELTYIGALDYFAENAIFVIEWPEQGQGILPPPDLICQLVEHGTDGRLITLHSCSESGAMILKRMTTVSVKV